MMSPWWEGISMTEDGLSEAEETALEHLNLIVVELHQIVDKLEGIELALRDLVSSARSV